MDKQCRSSDPFRLRVWGEFACFSRPEMKVERVSYDVMTPAAARSILEAIMWKPAVRWQVTRIDVLNPIRRASVRRNEVGITMSSRSGEIFIEDQRQQRAGMLLRDVDYVIHAFFTLTDKAGPEDTVVKFQEMFLRRAEKGQCFNTPYLGCREFSASFALVRRDAPECPPCAAEDREMGWMFYDHDFSLDPPRPRFFNASLQKGVLRVPPADSPEVRP